MPATKVTKSLIEEFKIDPDPSLYKYNINVQSTDKKKAKSYLQTLPRTNGKVLFHYKGHTSTWAKDLDDKIIRKLCNSLVSFGYTPIILDWDRGCDFADNKTRIFNPGRGHELWEGRNFGQAGTIAGLIQCCDLFVGIDSGPLHIAGATQTPSIGVWKGHHPIHFFDLCNNVIHLLPTDARKNIRSSDKSQINRFFEKKYRHSQYSNLKESLYKHVGDHLKLKDFNEDTKKPEPEFFKKRSWWVLNRIEKLDKS